MDVDPYLWLEDIDDEKAMDWVERHNEPTLADFRVSGSRNADRGARRVRFR